MRRHVVSAVGPNWRKRFRPNVCLAFVIAATAVASHAARVSGLLILSLDLKRCMSKPVELRVFWILLLLGTGSRRSYMLLSFLVLTFIFCFQVLSGVTVGTGTGQLA